MNPLLRIDKYTIWFAAVLALSHLFFASACASGQGETPVPEQAAEVLFADVTAETGLDFTHWNGMTGELYFVEMVGVGVALFDMDNDGDLDVYLAQGSSLIPENTPAAEAAAKAQPANIPLGGRLFRNEWVENGGGKGALRFTDVTEASGIKAMGYGMGVATGDYDNDGWMDLYLTFFGGNQLLRNCGASGAPCFEDVTEKAGVNDVRWSTSASFADLDADGFLDLHVANYVDYRLENHRPCLAVGGFKDYCGPQAYKGEPDSLFRNRGDGTFENITGAAGLLDSPSSGLGVVASDFDRDGHIDLYVANDMRRNFLWRNLGKSGSIQFENVALERGCSVSREGRAQASMGVVAGDFDNDGDDDLFMTHLRADYNTFYRNNGAGYFQDFSSGSGLAAGSMGATGFGTTLLDFDNDGWLDLAAANGSVNTIEEQVLAGVALPLAQPNQLFENRGDGTFTELSNEVCPAFAKMEVSRGLAAGDLDNDGRVDMLLTNNHGPARVLLNQSKSGASWIGLRVLTEDGKRDAFGSRIAVQFKNGSKLWRRTGTDGSYLSASDPRVVVGLGDATAIEAVEVHSPTGHAEVWHDLPLGQYHVLRLGTGTALDAAKQP